MVANEESDEETMSLRLLTTRELSRLTGLARWRIFELVRQGKAPPHMKIGNTLRFPQSGVVDWILEQSNKHKESA